MKHGHKRSAIKKKKRRMAQHAKEHAKITQKQGEKVNED